MGSAQSGLSKTFNAFFNSEKSGGILLIVCTAASLLIANSPAGAAYAGVWQWQVGGLSVEHWINDALMAILFLFIGLELERELYVGELSDFRNALLPIFAALGGMIAPALFHFALNAGSPTQAGVGIPMATDIAFALGILALVGDRIPASLKVFVAAYAVIDDLGAILVIAVFYSATLSIGYLGGALAILLFLIVLNRVYRVMSLVPYLLGGALMWYLILKSGAHATLAGVMLAFAIPFSARDDDEASPSHRLEHHLHKPVAFIVLPLFALANTGIVFDGNWLQGLTSLNSAGIAAGLVLGKPLGVTLLCFIGVASGACLLPNGLNWRHVTGAGILGGIGFTMSIFITNLAFAGNPEIINSSKMAILMASLTAGVIGFLWLRYWCGPKAPASV